MIKDNDKINLLLANKYMSINKLAEVSRVNKITISRFLNNKD